MSEFDTFIEILEISVKRNGKDKVLTIGHLANLAKMSKRIHDAKEDNFERTLDEDIAEFWNDTMRYGSGD